MNESDTTATITSVHTSKSNCVSEEMNELVLDKVSVILKEAGFLNAYWDRQCSMQCFSVVRQSFAILNK